VVVIVVAVAAVVCALDTCCIFQVQYSDYTNQSGLQIDSKPQ
jgi:hypothetical protein